MANVEATIKGTVFSPLLRSLLSPRRSCPRVVKFCMGSSVIEITQIIFRENKKRLGLSCVKLSLS